MQSVVESAGVSALELIKMDIESQVISTDKITSCNTNLPPEVNEEEGVNHACNQSKASLDPILNSPVAHMTRRNTERQCIPRNLSSIPRVYSELKFKAFQEPYSLPEPMISTLNAASVDTMLSGGLKKFFEKYKKLSTRVNLHLQTPEIRFQNLSYSVRCEVKESNKVQGTVGTYLRKLFIPCLKTKTYEKKILHPMTGIIPPGRMTLVSILLCVITASFKN